MSLFADQLKLPVLIIGGGLAGALVAANLLKEDPERRVIVIEPAAELGRGMAYAQGCDLHQANGPASGLSADPDDPAHFARWLDMARQGALWPAAPASTLSADIFPPRWLYGIYVGEILAGAARQAAHLPRHVRDTATDLQTTPCGVRVTLSGGQTLEGSHAVLATGLQFRTAPAEAPPATIGAWDTSTLSRLSPDARVAIIGAGLSMVDAITSLAVVGHRGSISVFSRHGLRPHPRRLSREWPEYLAEIPDKTTLRRIFARVVRECRAAIARGEDWQAPLDRVRPHIARWWHASSDAEKRRFLRHVRSIWETHHHRAPPEGHSLVESVLADGRLVHTAATVVQVQGIPDGTEVVYSLRGQSVVRREAFDAVIVSSGVEYDWCRISTPLVANLNRRGLVRPGPLRLGIDATPDGRVINASGQVHDRLLTLSHALRGLWWESTAIPDIARQARDIAVQIAVGQAPPA